MQRFLLVVIIILSFSGKAHAQLFNQPLPKKAGYLPAFFSAFQKQINYSIPSIGSFAVARHDTLIYEHYFHGGSDTTLFNIKSITKSVISALTGIAKDQGKLPDLNTPVLNVLSEYRHSSYPESVWFATVRKENDSIRRTLTLKHLLSMQTGFAWDDFGLLVNAFIASPDPVKFMLDLPFSDEPGETFNYCSGASSVMEAVLEKQLRTDLKEFANTYLFNPINVSLKRWDTDPTSRYVGASEMCLTTQDIVRFGLLYLRKGKVNNEQILSESWIKESLAEQAVLNKWPVLINPNGYGYFWWRRRTNGHQAFVASGAGGQLICIIPDLDVVIACTCFLNDANRGRMEIRLLHSCIDKVVAAIIARDK